MLRLKATSLRRKLGTVGGDAGTGQTWLAFGNLHWPLSGLVVYLLLPLLEALGRPNLYNTDGLYKRWYFRRQGTIRVRPITARLSVFPLTINLLSTLPYIYKHFFHHHLQTLARFSIRSNSKPVSILIKKWPFQLHTEEPEYAQSNLHRPASYQSITHSQRRKPNPETILMTINQMASLPYIVLMKK